MRAGEDISAGAVTAESGCGLQHRRAGLPNSEVTRKGPLILRRWLPRV